MASLNRLRGINLSDCSEDLTALATISSLRVLNLEYSRVGLRDCSPFLKAISRSDGSLYLQEWMRGNNERNFHLTKLWISRQLDEKACELLPLETHLQEFKADFNENLFRVLPRCSSIRSLSLPRGEETAEGLAKALRCSPFVRSLALGVPTGSLPPFSALSLSELVSLKICGWHMIELDEALTRSKPKSLTTLELLQFEGSFKHLAHALLACPSLTNLRFYAPESYEDISSVVQVLHRLPLFTSLTLNVNEFTNKSFQSFLSVLSQSAIRDLEIGHLSPKQLQLLADALSSMPLLESLEFGENGVFCEHETARRALFSALASSSLRSLHIENASFSLSAFKACLSKIPATHLTYFSMNCVVYEDGFDGNIHEDTPQAEIRDELFDWNSLFPEIKDRFCMMNIY
jgi:hypothetical protein